MIQSLINLLLQIDITQKVGTLLGIVFGMVIPAVMGVIINTAIGAIVGFVITTICKYLWEYIKRKFNDRKKNREIADYFRSQRYLRKDR